MSDGSTDWSDVLIAWAKPRIVLPICVLIGFGLLIWSGWASPENIRDIGDSWARAWRCQQ